MGLRYATVMDAPLGDVVAWHERPGALPRLLPPWQPLRVERESTSLREGRAVLRLPGGVRWVAAHSGGPNAEDFVDELTSLPLRWRHVHRFARLDARSTWVGDIVDTPIPGSVLLQTFRYRHAQLAGDLAAHRAHRAVARAGARPLTVAVTGSSGLIGSALCAYLGTGGHRVLRLVRRAPRHEHERAWALDAPDPGVFEGVDAVVHLAGASIAGRFTAAHKHAIRASRIGPTRALAEAMAAVEDGPRILVCASAIGYYGADRGAEELTEVSAPGSGFLAEVVTEWEAATEPARAAGLRVVRVRTGVVQSARGGALQVLRPLFGVGLGGPLAPGSQWVSWIGLDDLLDVFGRALVDEDLEGPVNAAAPEPVTNREYAATLARVLHRPAIVPTPAFGPRLLLGNEGAHELLEASQRVVPARLVDAGHAFRHPTLEACLRHQLGRLMPRPGEEVGALSQVA